MSLVIIVSGVLRNMKNASSSWKFNGDYHLITENNIYSTQSRKIESTLYDNMNLISDSFIKFRTVNICMDTDVHENFDPEIKTHPTINMVWKWKTAYYNILPYYKNLNYDRILLIRPDMYIINSDINDIINNIKIEDKQIHALKTLTYLPNLNGPWMPDMFLLMNIHTFEIMSFFYEYYVETVRKGAKDDIHVALGKYVVENNIIITEELSSYYSILTLRSNVSDFMFENGILNKKYTLQELGLINDEYYKNLWKH